MIKSRQQSHSTLGRITKKTVIRSLAMWLALCCPSIYKIGKVLMKYLAALQMLKKLLSSSVLTLITSAENYAKI